MLGTALITSDNGNMVGRVRYYPYGGIRAQEGTIPTDKLFTSQQRETTNGIYHYGARLYNADIGRMPQADTIVPEPMNPVAYNRYSYVYNNPVNYVDPTGCATAIPPYSTTTKEKTCSKVYSRNNNAGFLAIRLSLVIEFRYNGSKILSWDPPIVTARSQLGWDHDTPKWGVSWRSAPYSARAWATTTFRLKVLWVTVQARTVSIWINFYGTGYCWRGEAD